MQNFNNKNQINYKNTKKAWCAVLSSSLFFFYAFINMTCFNGLSQPLMDALNVSSLSISHLSAMYFYANILFLIPAGIILDKFSIRKVILFVMPISIASTYLFSLTHSYNIACVMRFIMGITSTFCLLSSAKLTGDWLSEKYAARAISLVVTIAMLGGVFAQQMPSIMFFISKIFNNNIFNNNIYSATYNWQDLLKTISIIGIICYVIMFLLLKDAPNLKSNRDLNSENQNLNNNKNGWIFALKNKQNYLLGFLTNFLSTPIMILGALWGSSYLTEVKHMSISAAHSCCSLLFIGLIIGSPFFGWASDILKNRKTPIIYGVIGSIISVLMIIYSNNYADNNLTNILMPFLFLLLGFFTASQVISYAIIIEVNPPEYCAFSESIASTIIMSSGAIFQPLFGYIITHGSYKEAMMIFPIVFVLCLFICFWIKTGKSREFRGLNQLSR